MRPLLILAACVVLAIGSAAAQVPPTSSKPPPDTSREKDPQHVAGTVAHRFYLHDPGSCGPAEDLFMDKNDSTDADRCGNALTQQGTVLTYPARGLHNVSIRPGHEGRLHLFLDTDVLQEVAVHGAIHIDDGGCTPGTPQPVLVRPGSGRTWTEFPLSCLMGGGAEAGGGRSADGKSRPPQGTVSATFMIDARFPTFVGYEGDHASYIEFEADPPPTGSSAPPTSSGPEVRKGVASLGAPLAAAVVASAVVLIRRPRG